MVVSIQRGKPFNLVFAEPLACGTSATATARGTVPEIVVDKVHGFHISGVDEGVMAVHSITEIS
jgi:hypothetical protein